MYLSVYIEGVTEESSHVSTKYRSSALRLSYLNKLFSQFPISKTVQSGRLGNHETSVQ